MSLTHHSLFRVSVSSYGGITFSATPGVRKLEQLPFLGLIPSVYTAAPEQLRKKIGTFICPHSAWYDSDKRTTTTKNGHESSFDWWSDLMQYIHLSNRQSAGTFAVILQSCRKPELRKFPTVAIEGPPPLGLSHSCWAYWELPQNYSSCKTSLHSPAQSKWQSGEKGRSISGNCSFH